VTVHPSDDEGEWLRALTRTDGADSGAVARLHGFIRAALARALTGRGVGDADLDDFAQDAVLGVLRRISTFEGRSRFTTWAMAIALRVSFTHMRSRRWKEVSLDQISSSLSELTPGTSDVPADAQLCHGDLLTALHSAIESDLSDRQRVAVLAELSGVPLVVLAERLTSTAGAVYKLQHDARKKLKTALENAGFQADDVCRILKEAAV
jgi:RNA polymerase sigma-70 factor (ECF subfamily)